MASPADIVGAKLAAGFDDLFIDWMKDAAKTVWANRSGGEDLDKAIIQYRNAVRNIRDVHAAIVEATNDELRK